jgi:hypothetical protein
MQKSDRDLMAPNTEPTDAELETVMREALALALERKSISDAWIQHQLREAVAQARARSDLEAPR